MRELLDERFKCAGKPEDIITDLFTPEERKYEATYDFDILD